MEKFLSDFLRAGSENFIHHARGECSRRDGIDVDLEIFQFQRQGFHQTDDCCFGCGVGADIRQRICCASTAENDDFAAPVFLKMRHRVSAWEEHAVEVDIHRPAPFRKIDRFQRSHRAIDASVQDQGVDIAEGLNGF